MHNIFFSIVFTLGMAFYIQGNYILADYGVLNGNAINWQDYKVEGMISHGLFILLLVVGFVLLKKVDIFQYMKWGSGISICIILIQLITLSVLLLQSGGLGKELEYVATTEDEFTYSQDENMFVLLLDTFDARVLNELLQGDQGTECESVLENFTYYPDTTAMYSVTKFAIPQILSGLEAPDELTYEEYVSQAFQSNDFYSLLNEKGWDCRMYSDTSLPDTSEKVLFENINPYTLTVSSHKRLGVYMLKLVGFRYMPQCLKKYFWFYSDDMKEMIDIETETEEIFFWSNNDFYDGIDTINTDNENGVFCFYHLEGTHLPFQTNRDMVRTDSDVGINEEGLAMMTMLDKFFSKLKELEIYDNSIIVIMADHGHYDYHQNPVFMVKGANEKHEFAVSDESFSYENVKQTFYNLASGKTGEEAVVEETDGNRRFYEVDKEELCEMSVAGDAADADYVQYTNKILYIE